VVTLCQKQKTEMFLAVEIIVPKHSRFSLSQNIVNDLSDNSSYLPCHAESPYILAEFTFALFRCAFFRQTHKP